MAKDRETIRRKATKVSYQSTLTAHWTSLVPLALPIRAAAPCTSLPRPGSVHSLDCKMDSDFRVRNDTPPGVKYLFAYSPPGTSSPHTILTRPTTSQRASRSLRALFLVPEDNTLAPPPRPWTPSRAVGLAPAWNTPSHTYASISHSPIYTETTLLTLNGKKAGSQRPSLGDTIIMIDWHTPGFLLLTKNPAHPYNMALSQTSCNHGLKIQYISANSPPHPDILPKARLFSSMTHYRGAGVMVGLSQADPMGAHYTHYVSPAWLPRNHNVRTGTQTCHM